MPMPRKSKFILSTVFCSLKSNVCISGWAFSKGCFLKQSFHNRSFKYFTDKTSVITK